MSSLLNRDFESVWHPFAPYTGEGKEPIVGASGAEILTANGDKVIDAISSWWAITHGHSHPHIARRMRDQMDRMHHVTFADFTHEAAVEVAERLVRGLGKGQSKVFFSDNGSTSVEVAIKMAIQFWRNSGSARKRFVVFEGSYHGDTFGAMSVGDRGIFVQPFEDYLFDVLPIPVPEDPGVSLDELFSRPEIAGIIVEPLVQGVAGMQMHSAEVLDAVLGSARKAGIITIIDEVMTGFGRTGQLFASNAIQHAPDIVCLSKGLTGGACALGATVCTSRIFDAFTDGNVRKSFLHGHTFTGNPIACAAALANFEIFDRQETWTSLHRLCDLQDRVRQRLADEPKLFNTRRCGTIVAAEVQSSSRTGYGSDLKKDLMTFARSRNVYLRPLGNTIYILPPYCTSEEQLGQIASTILDFVSALP